MKYKYKIIYDINKDMWNWRDAIKYPFMGLDWIDNIDNEKDREIANKIKGLKKEKAEEILKPYLYSQKNNPNSDLNKFVNIIEKDLNEKYSDACDVLKKITKHPLMSNYFIFYITTFPRMPFFYDKCSIFVYDKADYRWGMPIETFLHEGLHFQFIYYWKEDKKSPVSKLSDDEFDYLKEALTIVIDEDLKPLIIKPDGGYKSQLLFRQILHENWQKYHDFDKLINFGLSKLNKYFSDKK